MRLEFEIYYADLTELAQKELCQAFQTFEENENWTDSPLCVIEREAEEREVETEYSDIRVDPETLKVLQTRYNEDREDR